MSKANDSHLLQQRLPGITGILEDLGRWIATAVFEAGEEQGVQKCTDGGLPQALEPLFLALDLYKKVHSKHLKCIVLRIQGTRVSLKARHSADLIPVKVLGAVPTVEGLPLIPGFVTHITGDVLVNVEIGSVLDLVIIAEA